MLEREIQVQQVAAGNDRLENTLNLKEIFD